MNKTEKVSFKKYRILIIVFIIGIIVAIAKCYLYSFRLEEVTIFGTSIIYLISGFFFKKKKETALRWIFLLPIIFIILYGGIYNKVEYKSAIVFISLIWVIDLFNVLLSFFFAFVLTQKQNFLLIYTIFYLLFIFGNVLYILPQVEFLRLETQTTVNRDINILTNNNQPLVTNSNDTIILNNDFFKGKIILIDFWFQACSPCRQKLPALDSIQKLLGKVPGFKIVLIDNGQYSSLKDFKNTSRTFEPGIISLLDTDGKFCKKANIIDYPNEFIIKDGKIVSHFVGFYYPIKDLYIKKTVQLIRKLENER